MPEALIQLEEPSDLLDSARMYVLVRRDLPWPVRTVQATHAVMQLMRYQAAHLLPGEAWGKYGPAVVLLGVSDEQELRDWQDRLGSQAVAFHEPDLCDQMTAVAYYGASHPELRELRLM